MHVQLSIPFANRAETQAVNHFFEYAAEQLGKETIDALPTVTIPQELSIEPYNDLWHSDSNSLPSDAFKGYVGERPFIVLRYYKLEINEVNGVKTPTYLLTHEIFLQRNKGQVGKGNSMYWNYDANWISTPASGGAGESNSWVCFQKIKALLSGEKVCFKGWLLNSFNKNEMILAGVKERRDFLQQVAEERTKSNSSETWYVV